jgi:hypothetical protein
MSQPTPDRLLLQLIRLSRAQFDMRCAKALTYDLENLGGSIDARAYGLSAGMAVSYARPFTEARKSPYGALEVKWRTFPNRPDLREHHRQLVDFRNRLLAHNDLTDKRRTAALLGLGEEGRPAITEARSPIGGKGIVEVRDLCEFQESRFGAAVKTLADTLQMTLKWPTVGELDLDEELERIRGTEEARHADDH